MRESVPAAAPYPPGATFRRAVALAAVGAFVGAGCGASGDTHAPDAGVNVTEPPFVDAGVPQPPVDGGADASAPTGDAGDAAPPSRVCDVRDFGAKGDGKTKDTAAIQAAIDACATTGGTVLLQNGTFSSGMIRLRSHIALRITTTATLRGTQDDADYPDTSPPTDNTQLKNCKKALVYAQGVTDLHIEGGGTIDGNGNTPKWIGPSSVHPEATRPMAVFVVVSTNVTIQDVTVRDAAMWGLVDMEVDGLTIHHVTIDSQLSGTRDGIDVVDCHHVTIDDSTIQSEDDSICIKSGSLHGVDDVTVKNDHVVKSIVANGLKFGTASYGSFTNVTFDTITIDSADKAAMAVESVDGATVSNIVFRNITFKDVGSAFFVLLGDRGETPTGGTHRVGSIDGVRFENIVGTNLRHAWGSPISGTVLPDGTRHALKNLAFVNVDVTERGGVTPVPADPPEYAGQYPDPNLWGNLPASGDFLRHVDGVTFTGGASSVAHPDARKIRETRDVTGLVAQ